MWKSKCCEYHVCQSILQYGLQSIKAKEWNLTIASHDVKGPHHWQPCPHCLALFLIFHHYASFNEIIPWLCPLYYLKDFNDVPNYHKNSILDQFWYPKPVEQQFSKNLEISWRSSRWGGFKLNTEIPFNHILPNYILRFVICGRPSMSEVKGVCLKIKELQVKLYLAIWGSKSWAIC